MTEDDMVRSWRGCRAAWTPESGVTTLQAAHGSAASLGSPGVVWVPRRAVPVAAPGDCARWSLDSALPEVR